ncbi:MAG TPA: hypothetical protein VJB87_04055 [Candidatus Nanoarchaeia archaeon]|nr:hypothetical protein [Candidatus Nanoarchaeia archaeon]
MNFVHPYDWSTNVHRRIFAVADHARWVAVGISGLGVGLADDGDQLMNWFAGGFLVYMGIVLGQKLSYFSRFDKGDNYETNALSRDFCVAMGSLQSALFGQHAKLESLVSGITEISGVVFLDSIAAIGCLLAHESKDDILAGFNSKSIDS